MALAPIAERFAAPVFTMYELGLSRLGFEHPTFRLRGQHSITLRHRRS